MAVPQPEQHPGRASWPAGGTCGYNFTPLSFSARSTFFRPRALNDVLDGILIPSIDGGPRHFSTELGPSAAEQRRWLLADQAP